MIKVKNRVRTYAFILFTLLVAFILSVVCIDNYIESSAEPFIFDNSSDIPVFRYALLLGTSRFRASGELNPFFIKRIEAVSGLYHSGRVKRIIASGDSLSEGYNEVGWMKWALVRKGIPAEHIIPDEAGLRTLDSVVRCSRLVGTDPFLIVSQRFHIQRALFIARSRGINARGYAADDVNDFHGLKVHVREYGARVLAFLDVFLFDTEPAVSGP